MSVNLNHTYKLFYFPFRALAEPIRLLFAYKRISYEDKRISWDKGWEELSETMPWNTMPVLYEDGNVLGQSKSILRYLGHKYKLNGKSLEESYRCDEIVEFVSDFREELRDKIESFKVFMERNDKEKDEIVSQLRVTTFPKFLTKLDEIVTNGFLGNRTTQDLLYCDFYLASWLDVYDGIFDSAMLKPYPKLIEYLNYIFSQPGIKEWNQSRPTTLW